MAKESVRQRIEQAIEASCEKRKLAIPRVYLEILDDNMNASILLAQLVYWSDKGGRKDGTFYKSFADLEEETTLSSFKLTNGKDKLIESGFVSAEIKRANGSPVTHWKIHANKIIEELHKLTTTKKLSSDYQETRECTTKKLSNPLPSNLVIHSQETRESITKKLGKHEQKNTTKITTEDYNTSSHTREERESEILPNGFEEVWKHYPKRRARSRAVEAWIDLNPDDELIERMKEAIKKQKEADHWKAKEDNGRWIPLFENWLNDHRWEDEIESFKEGSDEDYDSGDLAQLFS